MEEELNLKVGDKLYERQYWEGRGRNSNWTTYIIKKVNPTTVSMKGYAWKIKKSEIGETYFTSKQDLISILIKRHEVALRRLNYEEVEPLKKEIKYLKRKLRDGADPK